VAHLNPPSDRSMAGTAVDVGSWIGRSGVVREGEAGPGGDAGWVDDLSRRATSHQGRACPVCDLRMACCRANPLFLRDCRSFMPGYRSVKTPLAPFVTARDGRS
jgi:hypothetical protein